MLMPDFAVILPAGGSASRFGRDKLNEALAGQPVLAHTLQAFVRRSDVACIAVGGRQALPLDDPRIIHAPGGTSRAHTVLNALQQVPESIEWVAVHDAARPLISQELIDRTLAAAVEHGAAAPALPVALTIKRAAGPLPAKVIETVPRHELWSMQTPQIMRRGDLLEAYRRCSIPLEQVTDDVQLLELGGLPVWLVPGEESNLKITTPLDLHIAEMLVTHVDAMKRSVNTPASS